MLSERQVTILILTCCAYEVAKGMSLEKAALLYTEDMIVIKKRNGKVRVAVARPDRASNLYMVSATGSNEFEAYLNVIGTLNSRVSISDSIFDLVMKAREKISSKKSTTNYSRYN
jgi:hypothetical protein